MSLLFSTIDVTRQVFFRSSRAFALVNLKPIVPGHVLVVPKRRVARISELNEDELGSLMKSVQVVGNAVERAYGADALTIACQDGRAAGQSVPHVHFHIMPRKLDGDTFANNDDIYPALETSEHGLSDDLRAAYKPLKVDADENRPPRTIEEMESEAEWLMSFFPLENP